MKIFVIYTSNCMQMTTFSSQKCCTKSQYVILPNMILFDINNNKKTEKGDTLQGVWLFYYTLLLIIQIDFVCDGNSSTPWRLYFSIFLCGVAQ